MRRIDLRVLELKIEVLIKKLIELSDSIDKSDDGYTSQRFKEELFDELKSITCGKLKEPRL